MNDQGIRVLDPAGYSDLPINKVLSSFDWTIFGCELYLPRSSRM